MKVLFLDIDGVLNSRRTAVAFGSYPHKLAHLERFDHAALGLVRRLCEAGVSVVLSSSWREEYQHSEIGRALDLPIIGGTPVLSGSRGSEIAAWLVEHEDVRTWAIVDDDPDMLRLLSMRLTAAGYRVMAVASAESALNQLELERPSLVLSVASAITGHTWTVELQPTSSRAIVSDAAGMRSQDQIGAIDLDATGKADAPW